MVPVYGTTLVEHRVLVLRGDQKGFDGFATLEVSLDAISTTDPFDTFTKTLCVGYDNVTLTLHSMVGRLGRIVAPIIDLSGRPVNRSTRQVNEGGNNSAQSDRSTRQVNDGGNNSAQSANHGVQSKGHIVIPYTQGLCESIKRICGRYGIQTHFKGGKTIKNLLVSPKDKDPMLNQSGAIYR